MERPLLGGRTHNENFQNVGSLQEQVDALLKEKKQKGTTTTFISFITA